MNAPNNDIKKTRTREAYCPRCDRERDVIITVSWQADICATCGADIDA